MGYWLGPSLQRLRIGYIQNNQQVNFIEVLVVDAVVVVVVVVVVIPVVVVVVSSSSVCKNSSIAVNL